MSEVSLQPEIQTCPAYSVLKPPIRQLLGIILREIDRHGGRVPISSDQFKVQGLERTPLGLRRLQALGLVTITSGSRGRNVFGRCNRWQEIDATEAESIATRYS